MLRRRHRGALAPLFLLGTWASPIAAHDLWLEPASFRPAVGSPLSVELRVGENFEGRPLPRNPGRISRFSALGPDGETELVGIAGRRPAEYLTPRRPGAHVIGFVSHRASLELEAGKFERYLAEEGLEHVLAFRTAQGMQDEPGREIYSRCAKAVVNADGQPGQGFQRRLGCFFELVPEWDPTLLNVGGELTVKAILRGRPLADVQVVAIPKDDPDRAVRQRTAADGRAIFSIEFPRAWLIKAVHMEAGPDDSPADWESWWATLTFSIGGQ